MPPVIIEKQNDHQKNDSINRHLSLFDLISIGVGGTVGSGIFVLCGVISNQYAGPSSILSWLLGGIAAFLSGCCYAELAIYFPQSTGSTYVFVSKTMGEFMGLLAAGCLSLEYVVAGAAVSRSWGDKLYLALGLSSENIFVHYNVAAGLLSATSVVILCLGVKESKLITNVTTAAKIFLVLFMAIGGLVFFQLENLKPFFPFGLQGTLRGSTSSFFGYLGFDAVCCFTGEANNPHTDMPRAVFSTIAIVTILYCLASLALVGMQPYEDIVGFAEAFRYNGYESMAQIVAWGEIITLPIVVLISLMAQPRLLYAVAKDGLLPKAFTWATDGNLRFGTCTSGFFMILLSIFVPFTYLNDFISAGILIAFCMTNSALILVRHHGKNTINNSHHSSIMKQKRTYWLQSYQLQALLVLFNLFSFITALAMRHVQDEDGDVLVGMVILVCVLGIISILITLAISYTRLPTTTNNNNDYSTIKSKSTTTRNASFSNNASSNTFQTPFVPYFPCMAIFINWLLITQLEMIGFIILIAYFGMIILFYIIYKNCFASSTFEGDADNEEKLVRNGEIGEIELRPEAQSLTLQFT